MFLRFLFRWCAVVPSTQSRCALLCLVVVGLAAAVGSGCSDDPAQDASADVVDEAVSDATPPPDVEEPDGSQPPEGSDDGGALRFGNVGSLVQPKGASSFRFGAATAAAQIEDGLTRNDWYFWTLPEESGGRGQSTPVGDAVRGASLAVQDVALLQAMNLDAYRFSVDWSRIEPVRDVISEEGLAHYDALIDALVAAGIRPMITVHHFSSPIWVHDFLASDCDDEDPVTDENLCGWAHPVGGPQVAEELAEFASLLAARYGDRVDEWCVLNEPINYILAGYGVGVFPPGERFLLGQVPRLVNAYRQYLNAYALSYDAIRAADLVDADDDGNAADIGLSLSVAEWVPASRNQPSDADADREVVARVNYIYHHLFVDSLRGGTFDPDLDGEGDEPQPGWQGRLDWLGVQYYFRAGATATPQLIAPIQGTICFGAFDFGACLPPLDASKVVPSMGYEFYEPGIYNILTEFSARWPDLPLLVTESGIAAENGDRRAENVVRTLEQVHAAIRAGADVRGYYHWSLMDNFEWAEGYEPRFGLYRVDRASAGYTRTPTTGATVLGEIAQQRQVGAGHRAAWGGLGPMSAETEHEAEAAPE